MAIVGREGLPRTGKSYLAVRNDIIPALKGGRHVWTNLPLSAQWIGALHNLSTQVHSLLHIVSTAELSDMFVLPSEAKDDYENCGVELFPFAGALVVFDEIQLQFHAKSWQDPSKAKQNMALEKWLTMAGHFGSDFVWLTQDAKQINPFIRLKTEMVFKTYKRNIFGMRGRIHWSLFQMEGGYYQSDFKLDSGSYSIEPKIYRCYESFQLAGAGSTSMNKGHIPPSIKIVFVAVIVLSSISVWTLLGSDNLFHKKKTKAQLQSDSLSLVNKKTQSKKAVYAPIDTTTTIIEGALCVDGVCDIYNGGEFLGTVKQADSIASIRTKRLGGSAVGHGGSNSGGYSAPVPATGGVVDR